MYCPNKNVRQTDRAYKYIKRYNEVKNIKQTNDLMTYSNLAHSGNPTIIKEFVFRIKSKRYIIISLNTKYLD